jgi:hypothetical protein
VAGKSSILFLMITSFNQEPGGSPGYNEDESILPLLPDPVREALLNARRQAHKWLMGGTAEWQGLKMKDDRRNVGLRPGEDFGRPHHDEARYRPAVRRLKGGHFLALGEDGLQMLCEGPHHVLMVCGLYGLITPTEPVQWHNCPVQADLGICDVWKDTQAITRALCAYMEKHRIRRVFDLTAVSWRRNLIDWPRVHAALPDNVLHCFDTDAAEDFALIGFAELLKDVLLPASERELLRIGCDEPLENRGQVTQFSPDPHAPGECAHVERGVLRDPTDEVDRCRRGLHGLLEQILPGERIRMVEHIEAVSWVIRDPELKRVMHRIRSLRNDAVYGRPLNRRQMEEFATAAKRVRQWAENHGHTIPEYDTDWESVMEKVRD